MAKVLVNDSSLTNIADAIRTKKESTDKYLPSEMADAILSIESDVSKEEQTKSLDITANGDYDILPDSGKVLSKATVNVNVPIPTVKEEQSKRVDITKNGVFAVQPDKGKVLSSATVFVNVPVPDGYIVPNGTKEITENGTHDVAEYSSVNVNVASGSTTPEYQTLYQRVEYIESAEAETYPYIITDFCADNSSGLEIIASFPKMQDRIPMGSRENSDATRFYCVYPLSTSSIYYGFNTGSTISCSLKIDTIYRLQTNFLNSRLVNVYEASGTRKGGGSISATLTQQTAPVSIFGYNSASSGEVTSKREYKLYSARCSRGHEVVREFIPCYRKSDGVIGLYEKFTDTFYTNDGTGSFAKGEDIEW